MVNLNRRQIFAAGLGTMAVVSLAACQQQTPQGPGSTTTTTSEAPKLPSTAWERAEASAIKDGGTLTLAVSQMPNNWNSDQTKGNLADLSRIRGPQGYSAATKVNEAGVISFNPDYIVKAELTSQSPQVVTVQMNDKAVWEDGSPINVKDLQAYAAALKSGKGEFQLVSDVGWKDIKEVKQTTDDFTCEIHFENPVVDWEGHCYPNLPASISSNPKAFNTEYATKPTPSQGPFKPKSVDATAGVITLERNPKWWGATPKLETIIFKVVTQEQTPSAFGNKEIDSIDVANGDVYQTAKRRDDAKIEKSNGLTWTHLTINTERVSDLEVRKAMALAINRELVGAAVIAPLEAPVVTLNNVIYMPGQDGYNDSWDGKVSYDKAKAEEALTAAGYAKGSDGVYAKDGKALTYTVIVPAGSKSNIDRATQVQKDLNAIGMKVEMQTVPGDKYFDDYVVPRNFDFVTFSWVGGLYAVSGGVNLFSPKDSQQNFTNWGDAKADQLANDANKEFDKAKRITMAQEFSSIVLNNFVIIPFYATPTIVAVKDGLVNFGASQFETVDWTVVGFKA